MGREHIESYKAITRNLDRAIGRHGLESTEAEALREESDGPWRAMTEAERDEAVAELGPPPDGPTD